MNRSEALSLLRLSDQDTSDFSDQVKSAFRRRAKQANPVYNGSDTDLRKLIAARACLLEPIASAPDQMPQPILHISVKQALFGGFVLYELKPDPRPDPLADNILVFPKKLRIYLPKGLRHGQLLRLKSAPQPLLLRVQIQDEDGLFSVGDDIWMEACIEGHLFDKGGQALIDTPHGMHAFEMGSAFKRGSHICLKGQGLPATTTHSLGHLYIRLEAQSQTPRPAADLLEDFTRAWA
jgi:DnaJ C terminal domain